MEQIKQAYNDAAEFSPDWEALEEAFPETIHISIDQQPTHSELLAEKPLQHLHNTITTAKRS